MYRIYTDIYINININRKRGAAVHARKKVQNQIKLLKSQSNRILENNDLTSNSNSFSIGSRDSNRVDRSVQVSSLLY